MFVSHSSLAMVAIVSPALSLKLPAPGTNPRLFWTRGQKQCDQPTLCIPVSYLCQARGCCAEARPCRTNRQSTVYEAEWTNMSPSESIHILLCLYRKLCSYVASIDFNDMAAHVQIKFSPTFVFRIPQRMSSNKGLDFLH